MRLAWANFSECKKYRYDLFRDVGGDGGTLTVVMLNPSTADASKDDPTIRRVQGFAKSWGFRFVHILNLFAFRATDPRAMLAEADPVGPDNDRWISSALTLARDNAAPVLAAWGNHGSHRGRDFHVRHKLVDGVSWQCLGTTGAGQPRHPLYVPSITSMRPFGGEAKEP